MRYLNRVIVATGKQNIRTRMPLNHLNILSMSLQHWDTLELVPRLHFPNPNWFISATRRKQSPRGVPRHAFHFIFMTLYRNWTPKFIYLFIHWILFLNVKWLRRLIMIELQPKGGLRMSYKLRNLRFELVIWVPGITRYSILADCISIIRKSQANGLLKI